MNRDKRTQIIVFISFFLFGAIVVSLWVSINRNPDLQLMVPGLDNRPEITRSVSAESVIGSYFERYKTDFTPIDGVWPGFRGFNRTNINSESNNLSSSLNREMILWTKPVGEGHAGVAINNGLVYLLDYDENLKKEYLRCFSLADGAELWRRGYNLDIKRNHGFSRSIPAVTSDFVVTIGSEGHVMAVNAKNGDFLWGIDIKKRYNATIPGWYAAQCPLVTNRNSLVLAPCGFVLITEIDLLTGDILWETGNNLDINLSHSSVIPMEIDGVQMFVYSAIGGVFGVSAEEENRGKQLWFQKWDPAVVAPSPVQIDNNRIFLTAGYGAGSRLMQVDYSEGEWITSVIFDKAPDEGLACEQQTPVLYKNKLYGIIPKDGRAFREQFVRCNLMGEIEISTGNQFTFGLGPFVLADNKFYVLKDRGELFVIEPETCRVLDSVQILDGHDAWAPMAIAGDYMILRDSTTLVCMDIGDNHGE